MRMFLTAALAAVFATCALAQTSEVVAPGQIGLVTQEDGLLVPLNADAGIPAVNKKEAGTACKLQEGDKFEIVAILEDGSILVKRKLHVRLSLPDKDTCPRGALVRLGKPVAAAAVQAYVAAKAVKEAAKQPLN